MKEYLIGAVIAYAVKKIVDYGVKKSKATENRIDDFIFNNLKELVSGIKMPLKKK